MYEYTINKTDILNSYFNQAIYSLLTTGDYFMGAQHLLDIGNFVEGIIIVRFLKVELD